MGHPNSKLAVLWLILLSIRGSALLAAPAPATQPAAAWAELPPEKWPQLVLTNVASFKEHPPLEGASSFLIQMPDNEILLATAKHLIKAPGGIDPPIALGDLNQALKWWNGSPRNQMDNVVAAKGLAINSYREGSHDWLLLHLVDPHARLPATPLTPRSRPAEIGETVYLLGVPYTDHKSTQNVYKGIVTSRPYHNYFQFEFSPPVKISGFSGAPIVDSKGLLLGHGVSKTRKLKQKDMMEIEFGCEDVAVALSLYEHRNDPLPATQPARSIKLKLPAGWVAHKDTVKPTSFRAQNKDVSAFIWVGIVPKTDFSDEVDLMEFARMMKITAAEDSKLQGRVETELKEGKIGDHPTVEYEITGTASGVKLHHRVVMIEADGNFCKLVLWTTPSHWDEAQPKFEDVVRAVK